MVDWFGRGSWAAEPGERRQRMKIQCQALLESLALENFFMRCQKNREESSSFLLRFLVDAGDVYHKEMLS